MIAPQKKPAFTLIELIVVITIIGVMTTILVFDFNGAKDRQELGVVADQSLAMLQQARADVASGKVRMDEGEDGAGDGEGAGENVFLCEGGYFEVGKVPQFVTTDYVDGECSADTLVIENYGISPGGAVLGEIAIGESSPSDVYVLFEPPEGEVAFNSGAYTGDASFVFAHENTEDLVISLEISEATGQFALLRNLDEE